MIETICGYEPRNDLLSGLELENMILRYDGAPMLAIYRYKETKTFFLAWLDYDEFYNGDSEQYLLFAITGKERQKILEDKPATNILISSPMRLCLYFKVLFNDDGVAYDEMIEPRPISLIPRDELFPEGVGIKI